MMPKTLLLFLPKINFFVLMTHWNGSAPFSLVHLLGAFERQKGGLFWGVLSLILGPNVMFKALEQASVYGQTKVINTDSLKFTCMAVSTERSNAVGYKVSHTTYFCRIFDPNFWISHEKARFKSGLTRVNNSWSPNPLPPEVNVGSDSVRVPTGHSLYLLRDSTLTNGERGGRENRLNLTEKGQKAPKMT